MLQAAWPRWVNTPAADAQGRALSDDEWCKESWRRYALAEKEKLQDERKRERQDERKSERQRERTEDPSLQLHFDVLEQTIIETLASKKWGKKSDRRASSHGSAPMEPSVESAPRDTGGAFGWVLDWWHSHF